ncbi:alpha/beta fold hydrolase [Modestobacter italicus]|uniref:alpha/beta fold hydrolase n=1 Tax=Modestobacter italicus (strain DSM 44449 / CECT 9708 / BC 501) TaxID=2732864 RepID=UPI001C97508B|nr:alpha/beta hydrolase [Modestobacter italicus]
MTDVVSFDGTHLAVTTWGADDAPLVVLVHGLGMSTSSWGEVPDRLAGTCRVVAYDLRGHARSGPAGTGRYRLASHAADLAAVLAHVRRDGEQVTLVGHSLGGAILLEHVAAAGAEHVAGAVFAGSGGSAVTVPGLPGRGLPAPVGTVVRTAWLGLLLLGVRLGRRLRGWDAVTDRVSRRWAFAPHEPADLVSRARADFLATRPRALAGTVLASISHDGQRLAPALTAPAVVVHGGQDSEVPDDDARRLLDALPDGELVTLPRSGHMLPLTDPEVVADRIAALVRRTQAEHTG